MKLWKVRVRHWRRNLFGRHGQSHTTFSGGTALDEKCRTTFQAHETFNHDVIDSQIEFFSLPDACCGRETC